MKLLRGLTILHIHGISPPVSTTHLDSMFSALPALQVIQPWQDHACIKLPVFEHKIALYLRSRLTWCRSR